MGRISEKRGFSLIELLVVVAIVGVLLSIALPSFKSVLDDAKRHHIQMLLIDIKLVQQQYWLAHGKFMTTLPLHSLPVDEVTLEFRELNDAHYAIKATLLFYDKKHPCRHIEMTPAINTPVSCW